MNETNEFWRDFNEIKKTKKEKNMLYSTGILDKNKIEYTSYNGGIHIFVRGFDFWPSTGKFKNRETGEVSRGIKNLLKKLK